MTNQAKPAPLGAATALGRPMAEALDKAVVKLASRIFLFLITYTILLIFLTVWTSTLFLQVRLLRRAGAAPEGACESIAVRSPITRLL